MKLNMASLALICASMGSSGQLGVAMVRCVCRAYGSGGHSYIIMRT